MLKRCRHTLLLIIYCLFSLNPSLAESANIYTHAGPGMLSKVAQKALPRVYVPNTHDGTVTVIDSTNYKVIDTFTTGKDPEHIVPSFDLKKLWVLNNLENTVTEINPNTGKTEKTREVKNPYNMYFTPDGKFAIVFADKLKRIDFRHPKTMHLYKSMPVNCTGLNHMDFSADGLFAIASCDESGKLIKINIHDQKVMDYLDLNTNQKTDHAMPQDVRLAPNGKIFYVADMKLDGIFLIDPVSFRIIDFIKTGKGTHSVYPSRDGKLMYVVNRGCNKHTNCPRRGPGSITVLNANNQKIIANWHIPKGGSPDMGNVSADGKELWLSGKYDKEVYVINTKTGKLIRRIPVGNFPHGLAVWPQPGRYSLGHTGIMR